VETGPRSLHVFDCSYKYERDSANRRPSSGTACMIQSSRFRSEASPVTIIERDWTEVMIPDKVDMGDSPFARKLLVLSKNPAAAKETVRQGMMSIRRSGEIAGRPALRDSEFFHGYFQ
jgi:hypothetical protein